MHHQRLTHERVTNLTELKRVVDELAEMWADQPDMEVSPINIQSIMYRNQVSIVVQLLTGGGL